MAMQKILAWMTFYLSFFKKSIPGGVFQSNHHLLVLNRHDSHVTLEAIKQTQPMVLAITLGWQDQTKQCTYTTTLQTLNQKDDNSKVFEYDNQQSNY